MTDPPVRSMIILKRILFAMRAIWLSILMVNLSQRESRIITEYSPHSSHIHNSLSDSSTKKDIQPTTNEVVFNICYELKAIPLQHQKTNKFADFSLSADYYGKDYGKVMTFAIGRSSASWSAPSFPREKHLSFDLSVT